MQLFLAQPSATGFLVMDAAETHHCTQVLRHRVGDALHAVDGQGTFYEAVLQSFTKQQAVLSITHQEENWGEPRLPVGLVMPLLRNRDRQEWLLEKSVELGVTHIYPALCQRSERTVWKPERAQSILVAGLKQNLRSRLPYLHELLTLPKVLALSSIQQIFAHRMIAHCTPQHTVPVQQYAAQIAAQPTLFCIGPEGDFTPQEVELALQHNFLPIGLGHTRLRAETAALYALAANKLFQGN